MKLMPVLGVITFIGETRVSAKGTQFSQIGVAVNDELVVATIFSGVSSYVSEYGVRGSKIFLEEWEIKKKTIDGKDVYDIIISRAKLA